MLFYNINECVPIDITFCNQENKNKEILQLKKYIFNDKLNHLNNVVLVLDRAYYSFELINFLELHNFNYVIRIKNNCTLIKNKELKRGTRFILIKVSFFVNCPTRLNLSLSELTMIFR